MNATFIVTGSRGDLYPILGLGCALSENGFNVTVITSGNFAAEVRAAGLRYIEMTDAESYARVTHAFEQITEKFLLFRRWPQETLDTFMDMRERLVAMVDKDLVGDGFIASATVLDFGISDVIAKHLDVPRVDLWTNARQMLLVRPNLPGWMSGIQRSVVNLIAAVTPEGRKLKAHDSELRKRLGLPHQGDLARIMYHDSDLKVGLFASWFLPNYARGTDTLLPGFPLYEPDIELSPELNAFLDAGPAPIVFTNASWRSGLEEFFRVALEACREVGYRAVCISPRAPRPPAGDPSAISVDFAPLKALLPRSAALVHHGGIGTVARAMAEATPQIVVPWTEDQPFNAKRVTSLGVGLSVKPSRFEKELVPKLRELLGSEKIRERNVEVSKRLQEGPDYRAIILRLERMMRERSGRASPVPPQT